MKDITAAEHRQIEGYTDYEVTLDGRVWSNKSNRYLKLRGTTGYVLEGKYNNVQEIIDIAYGIHHPKDSTLPITYERIHYLLNYNSDTGEFTWKESFTRQEGEPLKYHYVSKYMYSYIDGKVYALHRLAILYSTGAFPPEYTDHKNRVRDDNRLCNLRSVSPKENTYNMSKPSSNTSGVVGVTYIKSKKLWRARINYNKQRVELGCTKEFSKAVRLRREAEVKYGYYYS